MVSQISTLLIIFFGRVVGACCNSYRVVVMLIVFTTLNVFAIWSELFAMAEKSFNPLNGQHLSIIWVKIYYILIT